MGGAILKGWLDYGLDPEHITVIKQSDHQQFFSDYGVKAYASYAQVKASLPPHIVVIAVKPQMLKDVLPDYKKHSAIQGYITIAAGVHMTSYMHYLNCELGDVVRAMPNLPVALGKGMTGLVGATGHDRLRTISDELFTALGDVVWLEDESKLDALTAISGSGPAYGFYFIECLSEAAKDLGFDEETAILLAKATINGAGAMAHDSSLKPSLLKQQVISKKGTTEAALKVLEDKDQFKLLVKHATKAAFERARELAEES